MDAAKFPTVIEGELKLRQVGLMISLSLLAAGSGAFAQSADAGTQGDLTARTLYYNSGDTDTKAAQPKPAPKRTRAATTTSTTATSTTLTSTMASQTPAPLPDTPVPTAAAAPVQNLGVRYNVLLVDAATGNGQPVDPGGMFHNSDCLALSVQSNYDGYLYVLDKGSSGKWDVLLPSTEMNDESNFVRARTTIKAPSQYCFTLDNPPGVEHLYLVLARSPQDVAELNSAVKASRANGSQPTTVPEGGNRGIDTKMASLEQTMKSRDLKITKVKTPSYAGEPANAVYVVDTSHGSSDRLIAEIDIRHN
jgi:hypothetical protein